MHKATCLFLTLLAVLSVLGASVIAENGRGKTAADLSDLSWLVGSWDRLQKNSVMRESWVRIDDTLLLSNAVKIAGADTSTLESMKMLQRDSLVFFVAEVPHNDSAIYFRLTRVDSLGFHFENPLHDFPTHIAYRSIGTDSMHARIEGISDGKPQAIDFRFRRVQ